MKIEFIPQADATPEDFKNLGHDYGLACYFLSRSVKCSVNLGHTILSDLASGEPPRPRKMQLDEAEAQGLSVEHQRQDDDATNRRIEIDLQTDVLDVVEVLRIISPSDIVKDVLVEGVSIYQHWEELDGEEFTGAN